MDKYCRSECPDRVSDDCVLPSIRERAVARARVAVRSVMGTAALAGREAGDERFKAEWELDQAVRDQEAIQQRVRDCIDRHKFGEEADVIQLRTDS